MSYAQISDMTVRYPARDLIEITDPNAVAIQDAPITQAISDASAEIDGYLESRFTLPLVTAPVVLTLLCCDIAMYRLQALRPERDIKDAKDRYDAAIHKLEKVAKGDLTLGLSATSTEPPIASPSVLVTNATPAVSPLTGPIFTRASLRGF